MCGICFDTLYRFASCFVDAMVAFFRFLYRAMRNVVVYGTKFIQQAILYVWVGMKALYAQLWGKAVIVVVFTGAAVLAATQIAAAEDPSATVIALVGMTLIALYVLYALVRQVMNRDEAVPAEEPSASMPAILLEP